MDELGSPEEHCRYPARIRLPERSVQCRAKLLRGRYQWALLPIPVMLDATAPLAYASVTMRVIRI